MNWQQRYLDNDTPWDKGAPSPPLVDLLQCWAPRGRVLVPGCGFGHDAVAIAAAYPDCEVVGLDVAPAAIAAARQRNRHENCRFEEGDFLQPCGATGVSAAFDAIWEHTLFCAIDPDQRGAYAAAVPTWLKPGGTFAAVFYITPDPARGAGPPFGVGHRELSALFGSRVRFEREWVPERSYPGREERELMVFGCRI